MSAKRKHRTAKDYLDYLKGELPGQERHSFERELERDPFEQEALEGLEQLSPGEAEEDLLYLHDRLRKRTRRKRRIAWYSIAATVASIMVVGTIFLNVYEFNPDAGKEDIREEEALVRETVAPAKTEQAAPSESGPDVEESALRAEPAAGRAQEIEAEEGIKAAEEIVADQDLVAAEGQAMADDAVPEEIVIEDLEFDMAAAPEEVSEEIAEPDAALLHEAEPQDREKKGLARKRSRQAVPTVYHAEKAAGEDLAPILSGRVSGVVLSAEDMDPLPGATLVLKGGDSGYVTDMQGRFDIPAGELEQPTVVASYVGMVSGEYQLNSQVENTLIMHPDQTMLNEVVVVSYDAQRTAYPVSAVQKVRVAEPTDDMEITGAEPAGGFAAYKMYMENNIRFPAGDTLSKRGVVVLTFKVGSDGKLSGIQTLRSPGDDFTREALRLLEEGPAWNPARDQNGPTDDEVRMRIVFRK